jgi:hypothetical protein
MTRVVALHAHDSYFYAPLTGACKRATYVRTSLYTCVAENLPGTDCYGYVVCKRRSVCKHHIMCVCV